MHTLRKALLGAGVLAVFALAGAGSGKQAVAENTAAPVAAEALASAPLGVDDLAAKPTDHIGRVSVVGVVATANKGKGFLLIDLREYKECGLTCLTEPGTKKIPVRWPGDAPKVESTVRVAGTIVRNDKGFTFTAEQVGTP